MSPRRKRWLVLALLLAACGSRSSLRTGDAARFVDDDPWLKIDAGAPAPARDGGVSDALDARTDGRG